MPGEGHSCHKLGSYELSIGTLIGAFILDYLGPKYTMVSSRFIRRLYNLLTKSQIMGLLLQALTGFIMSGLYAQCVNCRIRLNLLMTVKHTVLLDILVLSQYGTTFSNRDCQMLIRNYLRSSMAFF